MAYAQMNYRDIQGINGTYRISQIGCFLTSFSNLLQRLEVDNIAPNILNVKFIEKGIYIDLDDGVVDDLNFQRITKLYPQVVVEQEGSRNNSMPTHSNAIVRIEADNDFGTHFCLVHHIDNGVVWVVDSLDGKVKKASVYGPVKGWATYKLKGASMEKSINDGDYDNVANDMGLPTSTTRKYKNWHDVWYGVVRPWAQKHRSESPLNNGDIDNVSKTLGVSKDKVKALKNWNEVFYQLVEPEIIKLQSAKPIEKSKAEKAINAIKEALK